jgi:hypothetical protein
MGVLDVVGVPVHAYAAGRMSGAPGPFVGSANKTMLPVIGAIMGA